MSAALESHPRETILSSMYILCTDCNVSTLKLNYFLKVHDFILLLHIVGPFISLLKGLFAHDPRHSEKVSPSLESELVSEFTYSQPLDLASSFFPESS